MNYLATEDGTVYKFGCDTQLQSYLKQSSIKLDQNFKRIYKSANLLIGLTSAGHLFQIKDGKSLPLQTAVDGQIYEIAPCQIFNFFDL